VDFISTFPSVFDSPFTSPFERIFSATEAGPDPLVYLVWNNFESEMQRAATANGHIGGGYGAFYEWILFDGSAFGLANGDAFEAAITAGTLTIANLDTYAAAYTP